MLGIYFTNNSCTAYLYHGYVVMQLNLLSYGGLDLKMIYILSDIVYFLYFLLLCEVFYYYVKFQPQVDQLA